MQPSGQFAITLADAVFLRKAHVALKVWDSHGKLWVFSYSDNLDTVGVGAALRSARAVVVEYTSPRLREMKVRFLQGCVVVSAPDGLRISALPTVDPLATSREELAAAYMAVYDGMLQVELEDAATVLQLASEEWRAYVLERDAPGKRTSMRIAERRAERESKRARRK